jgi:hypothetical protein
MLLTYYEVKIPTVYYHDKMHSIECRRTPALQNLKSMISEFEFPNNDFPHDDAYNSLSIGNLSHIFVLGILRSL